MTSPRASRAARVGAGDLIRLTADELAAAPHDVLASLVDRYQDELEQTLERSEQAREEAEAARGKSDRLERELEAAKRKADEVRGEQARMEDELSGSIEVLDKLRKTVRDLEGEKKDVKRQYHEQAETHETERQAWHDQEQHLKMRIADLTIATAKRQRSRPAPLEPASDRLVDAFSTPAESGHQVLREPESSEPYPTLSPPPMSPAAPPSPSATNDSLEPAQPSENELSLLAQLESLSTAHESLTSTLRTLQIEMSDLKRVYQDLQEENESYEILLGERTLSGEVRDSSLFQTSAAWTSEEASGATGPLEPVREHVEDDTDDSASTTTDAVSTADSSEDIEQMILESKGVGRLDAGAVAARRGEPPRRSPRLNSRSEAGGETLDLAAELASAERADEADEEEQERQRRREEKRRRKKQERAQLEQQRRAQLALEGGAADNAATEELRREVRALKDANKALTLYVSKIVDRVCQQEGFEKVLAVDYRQGDQDKNSPPPAEKKQRPASISFFGRSPLSQSTRSAPGTDQSATPGGATQGAAPWPQSPGPRGLLESVSSVFSFGRATPASPASAASPGGDGIRPLMLADSARKVEGADINEDEDDRRERARIHSEMLQLGFNPPPVSRLAAAGEARRSTHSSPTPEEGPSELRGSEAMSRGSSQMSLEEQERSARHELQNGRSSGFTEAPPRRMSLIAQRRASARRSPLLGEGANGFVGLGIDSPEATGPSDSSRATPPLPPPTPPAEASGSDAPVLRKALRRLSSAFGSPSQ